MGRGFESLRPHFFLARARFARAPIEQRHGVVIAPDFPSFLGFAALARQFPVIVCDACGIPSVSSCCSKNACRISCARYTTGILPIRRKSGLQLCRSFLRFRFSGQEQHGSCGMVNTP